MAKNLIHCNEVEILDFESEIDVNYPKNLKYIASVKLPESERNKCPICGKKGVRYDKTGNKKRWRSLDLNNSKFYIEAENPRCLCPEHGVHVASVPWAFPKSDYTKNFDSRIAYLAAHSPINLIAKQYRIKWHTVGSCVKRVQEHIAPIKLSDKVLKKLAIDEVSHKKGHKYLTTVMDVETGEIIWAADGFGDETLAQFFESISEEQRLGIEYVVADGARWITRQVEKYCPNVERCVDPFHVVGWATEALDETRKRLSNDAKKNGLRS